MATAIEFNYNTVTAVPHTLKTMSIIETLRNNKSNYLDKHDGKTKSVKHVIVYTRVDKDTGEILDQDVCPAFDFTSGFSLNPFTVYDDTVELSTCGVGGVLRVERDGGLEDACQEHNAIGFVGHPRWMEAVTL